MLLLLELQSCFIFHILKPRTRYTASTVLSITHLETRCYWVGVGSPAQPLVSDDIVFVLWHNGQNYCSPDPFQYFPPFLDIFRRANFVLKPFFFPLIKLPTCRSRGNAIFLPSPQYGIHFKITSYFQRKMGAWFGWIKLFKIFRILRQ